jgi:hypothetical protein
MWVYKPERSEGGNAIAMVNRAKEVGLTHIFLRTGSSWDGFQNATFLDWLLPLAHQNGIKVYGWDFPQFVDLNADVNRAMMALNHVAPGGNRLDGFAADIETQSEGTEINAHVATAYGIMMRQHVGPSTLLISVVPNPTPQKLVEYPYDAVVGNFNAIAPMVYWLNREPGTDTANAMQFLHRYGKPLLPIGQAYDGGPEGGRPGVPPPAELLRFMEVANQYGAVGISFWSWQSANGSVWDTLRAAPFFKKAGS